LIELNEAEVGISVFKNLGRRLVGVSEPTRSEELTVMSWDPAETKSWKVRPSFLIASRTEVKDEEDSDEANRELRFRCCGSIETWIHNR
jgi:hypothetical protein